FLSLKLWGIFLHRLVNASFPAEIGFLLFSKKTFTRIKESRATRVLVVFIFCDLCVRMIVFLAGVPFSGRYFLPWTAGVAILAGGGFVPMVEFIHSKILANRFSISRHHIYAFIILGVAIGYSIKALHPRNDKPWLRSIPAKIRSMTPDDATPVIISNYQDTRFEYYARPALFLCLKPDENWTLLGKVKRGDTVVWRAIDRKRGLTNLAGKIDRFGKRLVFIIFRLKKHGESRSAIEMLEKLPGVKLASTFSDRKKRRFNLYFFPQESPECGNGEF
ncbi:MAG: hypothetical protein KAG97_07395, partial [Victivallales bacterium]|nr:hypothetical protein [Victivallales bacterium]